MPEQTLHRCVPVEAPPTDRIVLRCPECGHEEAEEAHLIAGQDFARAALTCEQCGIVTPLMDVQMRYWGQRARVND